MFKYTLIALGILVSACAAQTVSDDTGIAVNPQTETSDYAPIGFKSEIATPAERAKCEAAGGEVMRAGLAGFENCIQTFSDSGKTCTDSSDCMGTCRAYGMPSSFDELMTGQCAKTDNVFGCYARIEGGRADGMICVD